MHNLGLGGLEFSPNHEIEEHHPAGYKVYEETLTDDGRDYSPTMDDVQLHFEPTTTTQRSPKHVLEIKINDEGNSEEIVLVKESQHRKDLRPKDGITVEVKSQSDNEEVNEQQTFISMHDPKHRHHKGECKLELIWLDPTSSCIPS